MPDTDIETRRLVTQQSIDASRGARAYPDPAAADIRTALRELRGELAGIRMRLDSLVAMEKQLGYQGQRLTAIEKRLATYFTTKLDPVPVPSTAFQGPPGPAA